MITQCPYCNMTTAGEHSYDCPNYVAKVYVHTQPNYNPVCTSTKLCHWKKADDYAEDIFRTACKEMHYFPEYGIEENKFKYCPYCGGIIVEVT